MRVAHFIKANAQNRLPRYIYCVDTETDQREIAPDTFENVLKLGFCAYGRRHAAGGYGSPEFYRFTDAQVFWDWLTARVTTRRKHYIFMHNVSFDALVLKTFSNLSRLGYKLVKVILDEPPTVFYYRNGVSTICIIDSLNFFRMPLAQLGANIDFPKLTMPPMDAGDAAWDTYCKQDSLVVWTAITAYLDFLEKHELGNFQNTLPAQAFSAYRHRFMPGKIFCDTNADANRLARKAYNGGRSECFYIGEATGKFYLLDVNSMYPWVMRYHAMPVKLIGIYKHFNSRSLAGIMGDKIAAAEVTLDTDQPLYPKRYKGRLTFPVGRFSTCLIGQELQGAIRAGHVVAVKSCAVYEAAFIFAAYVKYFYDLRWKYTDAGNAVFAWTCKLFLNSLYGKFGQVGRSYRSVGECDPALVKIEDVIDVDAGDHYKMRYFGGLIQQLRRESESMNSMPAIAATITAGARWHLSNLIRAAGRENVLYCDTDSLVVNEAGKNKLHLHENERGLGALKLQREFTYLSIRAVKDYTFGSKTKIKGIRANAEIVDDNTFIQDTFRGIKGMIRDEDIERQVVKRVTKHLAREYLKGTVLASGVVQPLSLLEF